MTDTNYFIGTVKILKDPIQKLVKTNRLISLTRVEVPQMRQNKVISLVSWGSLSEEIKNSYQKNDYLLIEGYSSINKKNLKLNKVIITVLKVYPLLLNVPLSSKSKLK